MKKLLRNKKGFTLIELIVVILILAVLAAILVPSIINYVGRAERSRNASNARSIYSEVSIELAAEGSVDTTTITAGTDCEVDFDETPVDRDTAFEVTCGDGDNKITFDGTNLTPTP